MFFILNDDDLFIRTHFGEHLCPKLLEDWVRSNCVRLMTVCSSGDDAPWYSTASDRL